MIVRTMCFFAFAYAMADDSLYHCSGRQSQQSLDLDQTLGMWYAVEVVYHRDDTNQPKGTTYVDVCPVVHFRQGNNSHVIEVMWSEDAGSLNYVFSIPDSSRPGFWLSTGAQTGSLLLRPYKQFAGTVEVTKAVGTHMVLTFCTPGTELYSIVLSRRQGLAQKELTGVNRLLERRGLLRRATREACHGGSATLTYSIPLLLLLFLISITK